MDKFKDFRFSCFSKVSQQAGALAVLISVLLLTATPASAHHGMGGRMPSTFFEGFISGIAHPLIGLDHFAFIVAIGLLGAIKRQGILIPISFVLTAMLGTGAHLAGINFPGVELFVSGSILLFGILLVIKDSPNTGVIAGLSAVAGLFHGYAYGESIFGAEMTPLLAYLIGFTVVQLFVSLLAFRVGKATILRREAELQSPAKLRSAGLVICGVGLAFFASQVIAVIFPVPGG
ncbi:HupE/UreJ family protein [Thermosynechococcaceae cyanobacterium BACA0444]|uniref:HupE/UreJ family protein n=1 Tax=Pseudocalidococcus azoricus BACA0444 TaxID=2918990 RepID=A0AAE4FQC1_9CYAN|nr:HupE/UreJ family protein [Pseudocalidococcus azoricus]MDS3859719.1 HupE/UreJ family protein [Pseudocalidococcus azoricus BACA0444]